MRAKSGVLQLTHSPRLCVKIRLNRFILSPSGGEKKRFLPFFGLQHLVMSTVGGNLRKLNTGAQLQTFPYPTASKSFLYSYVFMVKSGAQLWRSKAWRTKKREEQTKNSTFFAVPGRVKSDRHQTWHGDSESPACSCTCKTFGVWRIVSPLGGTENLGVTRPSQIKTPITP